MLARTRHKLVLVVRNLDRPCSVQKLEAVDAIISLEFSSNHAPVCSVFAPGSKADIGSGSHTAHIHSVCKSLVHHVRIAGEELIGRYLVSIVYHTFTIVRLGSSEVIDHLATAARTFVSFLELFFHNVHYRLVHELPFPLLAQSHANRHRIEPGSHRITWIFGRSYTLSILPDIIYSAGSVL